MSPETAPQTIERLKKWIDDLQSGMYINCVYCGHRYGPKDKIATSMQDALKIHIAQCAEHPMHAVLETLKAGRDLLVPLITNAVLNVSPSVVRAWVEKAEAAIDKAELAKPKAAARKKS